MTVLSITLLCGYLLDALLGEPKRLHPLVGFGKCAYLLEKYLNKGHEKLRFCLGCIAWVLLVLPLPIALWLLIPKQEISLFSSVLLDSLIIYWAIGHNSLRKHGLQIYHALLLNDISLARKYCGYIVSRETDSLSEYDISRATTESMLENGHDAVIATLVWYIIGGAPLVIIHRLANTLDAMWGYRNTRFNYFGRFSARADDILGFISAKITALLFAIQGLFIGKFLTIWQLAARQAIHYKSYNGGWVMSAGATLMNVKLGGQSTYHGNKINSPTLGCGKEVNREHIKLSLQKVNYAALLLIMLTFIIELLINYF